MSMRLKSLLHNVLTRLPKTYFAFPISEDEGVAQSMPKKRGVALIIAIMAVAMIMIFSSNMIVTSSVNLELAIANRDNVKAEFMAKSGQNLAIYLLSADWALDLFTFQMTQKEPSDSASDIWAMANGMPIGGDTLEMLTAMQTEFDLKAVNDEKTIDTLKLFDGQFVIDVEDELSKINVGLCVVDRCTTVTTMLEALMSCPSEKAFLEKKNLVPRQMAFRIKDWVDSSSDSEESGFTSEDEPYERKTPPYSAKNVPMESVNELRLIEGWDEEMHTVFSPYITIYPFLRGPEDAMPLNLNTASKELLGCLVPTAKTECSEKYAKRLIENQDESTRSAFATDKAGVSKFLSNDLCYNKGDGSDSNDRTQWFTYRSSVFRIKVRGEVGNQEKNLEMVIERTIPDKAKKIEDSYNILYWKMI